MPLPSPNTNKTGWPWTEEFQADKNRQSNNLPKISIVTPSYNQGEFIEETIRSVLLQNYPNTELIIIDGGSTDNTLEIITKYEKWISYWISEPDKGQTHAINKGIAQATGEVFNWLNSDDFLEKGALWTLAENYTPEIDFYCGICRDISPTYKEISRKGSRLPQNEIECLSSLHSHLHQPATYLKLDIAKKFAMHPELHYTMDLEFWLKYLLTFRDKAAVKYIDDVLVNFRWHDSSKTGSDDSIRQFRKDIYWLYSGIAARFGFSRLAQKIKALSPFPLKEDFVFEIENPAFSPAEIEKILHNFLFYMGNAHLKHGEKQKALAHYRLVNKKHLPLPQQKSFRNLVLGLKFPVLKRIFVFL